VSCSSSFSGATSPTHESGPIGASPRASPWAAMYSSRDMSMALPLEFPAEQMELVACELQLKLQRSHLANS